MAGLTVLDASILIAVADGDDAHASDAGRIVELADDLAYGTLTLAEALVKPVIDGTAQALLALLDGIGATALDLPADSAVRLAALRATTGLRMPDCYVLHLAIEHGGVALATRDDALRRAAALHGLQTP